MTKQLRKALALELSTMVRMLMNHNEKMEDICGALVSMGMTYNARSWAEGQDEQNQPRWAPLARWRRHKDDEAVEERRIGFTVIGGVEISTVAVLDEQKENIAYFETCVFNGTGDMFDYQSRTQNIDDAEQEHAAVCRTIAKQTTPKLVVVKS